MQLQDLRLPSRRNCEFYIYVNSVADGVVADGSTYHFFLYIMSALFCARTNRPRLEVMVDDLRGSLLFSYSFVVVW